MKTLWDTKIWSVLSFLSNYFEILKKIALKIIINIQCLYFFFKFKRMT
jgi:hypothetical protein